MNYEVEFIKEYSPVVTNVLNIYGLFRCFAAPTIL